MRQGARAFRAVGERQCQDTLVRCQLPHQRDIAVQGLSKTPSHAAVAREILPAVGSSDITGTGPGKAAIAGEMKCVAILPGPQIAVRARIVVQAAAVEVRREQDIQPHSIAGKPEPHQNGVAQRVRRNLQLKTIPLPLMHNPGKRDIRLGERQPIAGDALHLVPVGSAGDDETEIADLRSAGGRPIDLIDDPVSDGRPNSAGPDRRRDHVFRARCPGRRNPWPARRKLGFR